MTTDDESGDEITFLQRDPETLAAEANFGPNGALAVARCQDFYRQCFEVIEENTWADEPDQGQLGNHWRGRGGAQSTYYLMNVGNMLLTLMANASPGVGRTLKQRLRTLFRPPDDHAYQEALVELEVGGLLAQRISPVVLEPLVPAELRGQPNPPMSPDYGIRVPESLVTVEVTVWHWEAYAAWYRLLDTLRDTLSSRMTNRRIARSVRIALPIGSPQELARDLWSHNFCTMIAEQGTGTAQTTSDAAARPISVAWNPMPQFASEDDVDWEAVAASGGACVIGTAHSHAQHIGVDPCIDDSDRESALASLRRSIDRKKRQCDPTLPHFLAIGSTFQEIRISATEQAATWDVFGPLIEERLWPNPRYSWLSGVLLLRTSREADPNGMAYWMDYVPNPNAAVPAPETARRAFMGETEFHAMWQRPRREP